MLVDDKKPRSAYAWVAYTLGKRIVSGVYAQGAFLPNEATIGAELQVSRTVLREAFKLLSAKGLIESRPKLGTHVRSKDSWNMLDADVLRWCFESAPSTDFLRALFEVRDIIEPNSAALAAQHATPEQIAEIEQAYYAMENARLGTDEVIQADIDFHMAILRATNNQFMVSLGQSIKTALMGLFRISSSEASGYVEALPGHKAVFLGIRDQDAERARLAMQSLLSGSVDRALEGLYQVQPQAGTTA